MRWGKNLSAASASCGSKTSNSRASPAEGLAFELDAEANNSRILALLGTHRVPRPIVGLANVDGRVERILEWQRRANRDKIPFEKSGLR
jgi:hypothetical protein